MKKFSVLLTLLWLLSLKVQGQECYRLLDSLNQVIEKGQFQQLGTLVPLAERVCVAEVGEQDSLYADLLSVKAAVAMLQADFQTALNLYRQGKELCVRTRGFYSLNTSALYSDEGGALSQLGLFDQALADLDTALLIKIKLGDTSLNLGVSYLTRGQILMQVGRYADAKKDMERSLQNARDNNIEVNTYQYLTRMSSLGILMIFLGENEDAVPILELAMQISIELFGEENPTTITIIHSLSQGYGGLNQWKASEKYALRALDLAERVFPTHPMANIIRINLAMVYKAEGRYAEELDLLLHVRELESRQPGLDPANFGTLLNNIGTAYLDVNDLAAAMPYLTEARELLARTIGKNNSRYAICNGNLATCHSYLGNAEMAHTLAAESFDLIDSLGENFPEYRYFLSNLASTLDDADPDKERLLKKVTQIARRKFGVESTPYAVSLFNYAGCIGNLGRRTEGLDSLIKARNILESQNRTGSKDYADVLRSMGTAYERLGKYTDALKYYQKALDLLDKNPDHDNSYYAFLLQAAADMEETLGTSAAANARYQKVDALYHQLYARNFPVLSDAGREAFLNDIRPQLDHWHSFAWRHARDFPEITGEFYNDALAEKGQLLYSARSVSASLRSDSSLHSKMVQWLALRQEIDYRRNQIAQGDTNTLRQVELKEMIRDVELLESELTQHSKAFESATQTPTWQDVQKKLAANEAAIEFYHFNYYESDSPTDSVLYIALVLRKKDPKPVLVPLFEEKQLIGILEQGGMSDDEWLDKTYPVFSDEPSELYRILWEPLEPLLRGIDRIQYTPSGLLHRVALPAVSKGSDGLLLHRYDLRQLGSTRELVHAPAGKRPLPDSALILACVSYPTDTLKMQNRTSECVGLPDSGKSKGPSSTPTPLPGTGLEAEALASELSAAGIRVRIQLGYEPLEDDFRQTGAQAPSPGVLIFTTHGFAWDTLPPAFKGRFPRHNPMYSCGLLLAGSEQAWESGRPAPGFQDGILTAREIGDMDLQGTQLVMLSACNSGRGVAKSSEGVYGLQRAFKLAAARQVLATLWEIPDNDETRAFTTQFCRNWLKLGDTRAALRKTQMAFAAKGAPVQVWAAWILI